MREDIYPTRKSDSFDLLPREDKIVYDDHFSGLLHIYEELGYCLLPNLKETAEKSWSELVEFLERIKVEPEYREIFHFVYEEQSSILKSIFGLGSIINPVGEFARKSGIVEIVEQILGARVFLHQSRLNIKPAYSGREFGWHSDFETWHAEDGMARMRAMTAMVALTDNTRLNGSLIVIPASHKVFVSCPGVTPSDNYKTSLVNQTVGLIQPEALKSLTELGGMELIELSEGDCLLFDCNLAHSSNLNLSPFNRENLFLCFNHISNQLQRPFRSAKARPWFLGQRDPSCF